MMNRYLHHIGDFIRATVGLTLIEYGAYCKLLHQYYATEEPLPLKPDARYLLIGARARAEKNAVDFVVRRYFVKRADGWHQKRADEEIGRYRERGEQARAAAGARWQKADADAMQTHSERNADGMLTNKPLTNNHNPSPKPKGARSRALATDVALPAWMPREPWEQLTEHRREIGKPLTPQATRSLIAKLGRMRDDGQDIAACIEQTIVNGWTGVFEINGRGKRKRASAASGVFAPFEESTNGQPSDDPHDDEQSEALETKHRLIPD